MAELKKEETYLAEYPLPIEVEPQTTPSTPPEMQPVHIPEKRMKRISVLEKLVIGLIVLGVLGLAFGTVYMSNEITKVQENITTVQNNIDSHTASINQLQQEKTELSRAERIKEIAAKLGLTLNEANIRNVK